MIRVHIRQGLLGEGEVLHRDFAWRPGITGAQLTAYLGAYYPGRCDVGVGVAGRRLLPEEEIQDGQELVVAVEPTYGIEWIPLIVYAVVAAVVSVGISYAIAALTPKPKPPGQPQERGDEESATAAWDVARTSYGQGMIIPVVAGRHGVAGQVIYTDVFASSGSGTSTPQQRELLRTVLALGYGPIARIGDFTAIERNAIGGYQGMVTGGAIPQHIRVAGSLLDHTNPLPGAVLWFRPGGLDQSPLPTNPFRGATSLYPIGDQLEDLDAVTVWTYTDVLEISTVVLTIAFPGGLFRQDGQGNLSPYPVQFRVLWQLEGETTWHTFWRPTTSVVISQITFGTASAVLGAMADSIGLDLMQGGVPVAGPINVQVTRITARGGIDVQSSAVLRAAEVNYAQEFSYPGIALLGFEILATGRFSGELPDFQVRVDGALVRVWDETAGFSPYLFDSPTSGAWAFMPANAPPGRSPAWFFAEFAVNKEWGAGAYYTDDDIDWPAIRRWAAFCATDPNPADPWGEPGFQYDDVHDSSRPIWERMLRIAAAGRAVFFKANGKLTVVYRYRDSHGDLGITVPAKAPVQLLTSAMVEDLQVTWLPRGDRSTVYQFQFLDEALLWRQNVVTVEDREGTQNDPTDPVAEEWRSEDVQGYGVTRKPQHQRDGVFMHRVNRLVRREVTFRCGPWTLACTVGDLFLLEHDLLRPFGADVPQAVLVLTGGTATTSITIDHVLTGSGLAIAFRDEDGAPQTVAFTYVNNPTAGTSLLTLASAKDVPDDAPAAIGVVDHITEPYEVLAITQQQDLRREVRALQWAEDVYDPLAPDYFVEESSGVDLEQPPLGTGPPAVFDLTCIALGLGQHLLTFARPQGVGSATARAYVRPADAALWFLVGESSGSEFRFAAAAGAAMVATVVLRGQDGNFALPEAGPQLEFVAAEFPPFSPPAVRQLQLSQAGLDLVAAWPRLGRPDVIYELRAGTCWAAARPLYRGPAARVRVAPDEWAPSYQVRAQGPSGLFGEAAVADPRPLLTAGLTEADSTDWVPIDAGTLDDLERTTSAVDGADVLSLVGEACIGTFEAEVIDLTTEALYLLAVELDLLERELSTVAEHSYKVGSGEARWRQVSGRPASPAQPGFRFDRLVSDCTGPVADYHDQPCGAGRGEIGTNVLLTLESRTRTATVWSAWAPHQNAWVTCDRWQIRITLRRRDLLRQAHVRSLLQRTFTL